MRSLHRHFTSPRTAAASAAAMSLRNVFSMVLVSALLGSSALLAGCSDAGGTPENTGGGAGVGGDTGSGGQDAGSGGQNAGSGGQDAGSGGQEAGSGGQEAGSGGQDAGSGGGGDPSGECTDGSTDGANTDPDDPVQQGADHLVGDLKFPAVLVAVGDRDGQTHHYTSGVGDLETEAKVPVDGQVRIGSSSKSFTAVVVLQLVGEGDVDLDAPIETYLPDLVRGDGIDGREITVRQLLQHTSGLPDYDDVLLAEGVFKLQHTYLDPHALLDMALAQPGKTPGSEWAYSNTNYVLAGMIIEKVTGRPLNEEITRRIIERIGLRHTYLPGVGEQGIRGCHPKGYHTDVPGEPLQDITELDPGWGWAAGQVIATPSDLNRFYTALFGGDLLEPAQLEELRTTVDAPAMWPGARYGLGVVSTPLSCGGLVWGHGGDIPGYHTRGGVTDDGRAVTVAITVLPYFLYGEEGAEQAYMDVLGLVDTALCE
ncbi:serine hydrolase domain-containing protein [Sorangium sp. So ce381]|uniref:serine hydrolase domain-containing protein n=1 Tax=Sorangium sp. So ce381 TaxID=3133307 RepID=UPI003F5BA5F8